MVASNKWALILGASRGLGWATAQQLATQGFNLLLVHRDPRASLAEFQEGLEQMPSEVITHAFNKDATRSDGIAALISNIKEILPEGAAIAVMIHAIAKGHVKPLAESESLTTTDMAITLEAMASSLMDWTQQLNQAKLFAKDTRIISFTSEGSHKAWKHYAAVGAAKAALEAITRSIALEFAPHGIRANCIQAGVVDTASLRRIPNADQILKYAASRSPFKRITTPEDVAQVAGLLCRPEAAWINGAVIPVDGGAHIQ
ncbi:SDR family oxidoreductase [Gilvibacter sediminis]|uniref:SDR family oxidoreductase n=1 Tax=Gilvibacter sediminis TaxID=379071 RepID=UPI00234FD72B|nr:SDR family oxidoreductase [Gilvibacter sediminis]MDC7998510.1 SDR family oxidoreductase [Gilvibacter sediminis]